jgi:hypothetical protein
MLHEPQHFTYNYLILGNRVNPVKTRCRAETERRITKYGLQWHKLHDLKRPLLQKN